MDQIRSREDEQHEVFVLHHIYCFRRGFTLFENGVLGFEEEMSAHVGTVDVEDSHLGHGNGLHEKHVSPRRPLGRHLRTTHDREDDEIVVETKRHTHPPSCEDSIRPVNCETRVCHFQGRDGSPNGSRHDSNTRPTRIVNRRLTSSGVTFSRASSSSSVEERG